MTDAEIMRDEFLREAAQIASWTHRAYEGAIKMACGRPERLAQIQRQMQADYERNTRHIVRALGALPPPSVFLASAMSGFAQDRNGLDPEGASATAKPGRPNA